MPTYKYTITSGASMTPGQLNALGSQGFRAVHVLADPDTTMPMILWEKEVQGPPGIPENPALNQLAYLIASYMEARSAWNEVLADAKDDSPVVAGNWITTKILQAGQVADRAAHDLARWIIENRGEIGISVDLNGWKPELQEEPRKAEHLTLDADSFSIQGSLNRLVLHLTMTQMSQVIRAWGDKIPITIQIPVNPE